LRDESWLAEPWLAEPPRRCSGGHSKSPWPADKWRANENANDRGSRDVNLTSIPFKRAEAISAGWPPNRNAIAGTAAGMDHIKQFKVTSATSSNAGCLLHDIPESPLLSVTATPSRTTSEQGQNNRKHSANSNRNHKAPHEIRPGCLWEEALMHG
jgi:hypothetical protein